MPKLIDDSIGPIGATFSSMLSEAQFQSLHGAGWILADGRSVAGSKYALITGSFTAPDARGLVLRGKNNTRADGNENPDGESALGAFQPDQYVTHSHSQLYGGGGPIATGGAVFTGGPGSYGTATSSIGGNETRMKNVTVNHFIRIN